MRILHVTHGPVLGGAERSLIELARAQRDAGHDVRVAVGMHGRVTEALDSMGLGWSDMRWSPLVTGATVRRSPARLAGIVPHLVAAAARLRRLVTRADPDVVHVHTRKSQLVSAFALQRHEVPLLWHLRDDVPPRRSLRVATRLAMRRVDHAVALSAWMVDRYLAARARPRSGRIGLVPSGVDASVLATLDTPFLDGRRPPVVGFVGQIARWKAPHLLIDAAEHLDDLPDVTFRIVGAVAFPAAEDDYGRWLATRLARSPAASRIVWDGAVASPEDAFRMIDILAHCSTSPEPFGRVLVEAMAARRPIAALRSGAAAEILDDGCAVFAAAPDGPSLAGAIHRLASDRASAGRIADVARARAHLYSPDAVARRMEAEYRSLGARSERRSAARRPAPPADRRP
jgi:glycosyltransferase involved in cell wall biosynthesis